MHAAGYRLAFATIIEAAQAAHAQVLAESIATHMPSARFTALLVDEDAPRKLEAGGFDVLWPERLDVADLADLRRAYTKQQLASALRPSLLRFLLEHEESVILLDPEVEVFAGLEELAELARHRGIVLVPSVLEPPPLDGLSPTEPDLQELGIYNVGCLAVGRKGRPFLDWHAEHLRRDSVTNVAAGSSLDQRWLDFVPAYFEHHLVRDPGFGVGSWNLHERRVVEEDGRNLVNGSALRFFNFRGFDPGRPHSLTSYLYRSLLPPRARLSEQPEVMRMREAYADSLLRHGSPASGPEAVRR